MLHDTCRSYFNQEQMSIEIKYPAVEGQCGMTSYKKYQSVVQDIPFVNYYMTVTAQVTFHPCDFEEDISVKLSYRNPMCRKFHFCCSVTC